MHGSNPLANRTFLTTLELTFEFTPGHNCGGYDLKLDFGGNTLHITDEFEGYDRLVWSATEPYFRNIAVLERVTYPGWDWSRGPQEPGFPGYKVGLDLVWSQQIIDVMRFAKIYSARDDMWQVSRVYYKLYHDTNQPFLGPHCVTTGGFLGPDSVKRNDRWGGPNDNPFTLEAFQHGFRTQLLD